MLETPDWLHDPQNYFSSLKSTRTMGVRIDRYLRVFAVDP
jgi:hypothetical protein